MLSTKMGSAEVGRGCFYRVGGDYVFPGNSSNMSSHQNFPGSYLVERERESERDRGRARG